MRRLIKAFLDIALWRQTPAVLPSSRFLLALVAIADVLVEVAGDWLPPPGPREHILLRVLLTLLVPIGFTGLVLALTQRRQRFLQTGSAVLGIDVLAGIALFPLDAAIRSVGVDRPLPALLAILSYAGLLGYLLANMNIWRAALDTGVVWSGLVSLGYVLAQLILGQELISAR